MTRSISATMAPVLERLELDRPDVVTTAALGQLLDEYGVASPTRVVAARLRASGWLLPTEQRGVWEFAPAAQAGPYSSHDPLLPFRAFVSVHSGHSCALTFQVAAWARGLADRVPTRLEVAAGTIRIARQLPRTMTISVFRPVLEAEQVRAVPVLRPESILVHMAAKPNDVRSWASAREWLPAVAAELGGSIMDELRTRPHTVRVRTGYLLQGLRPDIAEAIRDEFGPPDRTWFGRRGEAKRHDRAWRITDTLLPFNPADMGEMA